MSAVRAGARLRWSLAWLLLLAGAAASRAAAQEVDGDTTAANATLYLKEGAVIRGRILADNGPNGIRIRSQKSGATFVVPAAQIDSVVRDSVLVAVPLPPVHAPVQEPAQAPIEIQVQALTESISLPVRTDSVAALPPPAHMEGLAPPPDTAAVETAISFISGAEIYINAGRLDGLTEGSEVSVYRGDVAVATLRVKFIASHKASTELVQGVADLAVGERVQFHRPAPGTAPTTGTQIAVAPPVARPRRLSGPGMHGRIGTRYLRATTTTSADGRQVASNGFNQPSLDARLYGQAIGGSPLGVAIDLRARQTTTTSAGVHTVDGHTRAYQAVLFWNAPDARFRVAAGRQYLATVSSIGLFDGGLVELNGSHLTFGGFLGWEPDPSTLAFSSSVHDFGGYLTLHNRPGGTTASAFTLGAVGSYQGSTERREWALAQATVSNRYLSLYVLQEVDYYRPWKLEGPNAESSSVSWTSQFANVSVRPKSWLSINATYDKRRNVRLVRDFTNPETNFDDAYREGYGAGVQYSGRRFYLGGDWRRSTGATVLGANSFTATLGANQVGPLGLGFSTRATWYRNENDSSAINPAAMGTMGQLYSGHVSLDPVTQVHLDLNAGLRQEDNPTLLATQRSTWYGVDVDVAMARQWYASFSALHQQDPGNPGTSTLTQIYGGVTWRF